MSPPGCVTLTQSIPDDTSKRREERVRELILARRDRQNRTLILAFFPLSRALQSHRAPEPGEACAPSLPLSAPSDPALCSYSSGVLPFRFSSSLAWPWASPLPSPPLRVTTRLETQVNAMMICVAAPAPAPTPTAQLAPAAVRLEKFEGRSRCWESQSKLPWC